MSEMAKKSVWIHVTLPGQDDFDETLPDNLQYPNMDEIAYDLLNILDYFELETIIGFGEGAGANILTRFALMHPNRCLGLVVINCTSGTATLDERMQLTMANVENGRKQFVNKALKFLQSNKVVAHDEKKFFTDNHLNPINVSKYFQSYLKRSDISKWLSMDLNVDCFVVTAKFSPQKVLSQEMVRHMDKLKTTLLVVDDVADVLYEAEKVLTRSLILFCKGCGVLLSVPLLGLEREFKRVHEKQEFNEAESKMAHQIQMYETLLQVDI